MLHPSTADMRYHYRNGDKNVTTAPLPSRPHELGLSIPGVDEGGIFPGQTQIVVDTGFATFYAAGASGGLEGESRKKTENTEREEEKE
jgi:hypothetical protein